MSFYLMCRFTELLPQPRYRNCFNKAVLSLQSLLIATCTPHFSHHRSLATSNRRSSICITLSFLKCYLNGIIIVDLLRLASHPTSISCHPSKLLCITIVHFPAYSLSCHHLIRIFHRASTAGL